MKPPIIRINEPVQGVDWKAYPTPQAIITSPPYWQKRAYPISNTTLPNGDYGQLGREDAADDYIDNLAAIMSGLPLREDGVMWINIGDTYADKSLSLIPAQFALAMKRKGWFVRSMIVWYKKNAMPDTATDRPGAEYESIVMLTKSPKYKYDVSAVTKPIAESSIKRSAYYGKVKDERYKYQAVAESSGHNLIKHRNERGLYVDTHRVPIRDVWHLTSAKCNLPHTAPMPPAIAERCILLSTSVGDYVLDPFAGTGTTLRVAAQHGRKSIGVELDSRFDEWTDDIKMQGALC